jgi:hypothetical protein
MRFIGHTAGVYVNSTGQRMVLESTTVSRLSGEKGVQLNPMGKWVAAYPGHVGIRQRTFVKPECNKFAAFGRQGRTDQFIRRYRGTSYPDMKKRAGRLYLIRAAWDSIFFHKTATNVETDIWIFCTDLIGRWYRWMGMIPTEENCAELEPDDMFPGKYFDTILKFPAEKEMQSELGEIIWIK